MYEDDELQRVLQVRRGGGVRRYHTEPPTVRPQSNAEHQWGVAMLLILLHPNPSPALLHCALTHDVSEGTAGDMPAPFKWANPRMRKLLEEFEHSIIVELGLSKALTSPEEAWLKAADYLEAAFYCFEQRQLGNLAFEQIFWRLTARMETWPLHANMRRMLQLLREQAIREFQPLSPASEYHHEPA